MERTASSGKSTEHSPLTRGGVKLTRQDDALLDARINANTLDYPKGSLLAVAIIVAFQPVYLSHAINGLDWTIPTNLSLYIVVALATVYMLTQAYVVMVESEFWRRQRHYSEVGEKDEKTLRSLRLQVAVGYTLFFVNTVFAVVCTTLLLYIFRHTHPHASFVLSPTITSALLWLVAQKNEESRRRKMAKHK